MTASPASAVTVHVATNGTDEASCGDIVSPCATLGYALDLATVAGPGDVIDIAAGTYAHDAQLTVSKGGVAGNALTIKGAGPSTLLDGTAIAGTSARVIIVSGGYVEIANMTLTASPGSPLRITSDGVVARDLVVSTPREASKPCVQVVATADVRLERLSVHTCTNTGISISNSSATTVSATEVSGAASNGVIATDSSDVVLEGIWVHDNNTGGSGTAILFRRCDGLRVSGGPDMLPSVISGAPGYGINIVDGTDALIDHTLVFGTAGGIRVGDGQDEPRVDLLVDHVTIGDVSGGAQLVTAARRFVVTIQNSVLAFNPDGDITDVDVVHQHNLRFDNGTGNVALDPTEVELDPLFADRAGGDYHLRSTGGRYAPASGWVTDAEHSPAIDLADPAALFALETTDNGGRANAGAYGNTPQASRSGPGPDAGVVADAAVPDSATPDSAAPDAVAPDSGLPDSSAADSAAADVAIATDTLIPDSAAPDTSTTADGAMADGATLADTALPDTLGTDTALPDVSVADVAERDGGPEDTFGQIVIARAGADQILDAPAQVLLDGTASTAPAAAFYVWTMADGPLGAGADPLGAAVDVQVDLYIPGLYIFQLTISWAGMSDSDLVAITVNEADGGEVAAPCECASARSTELPTAALLLIAVGLLLARRRFASKPS